MRLKFSRRPPLHSYQISCRSARVHSALSKKMPLRPPWVYSATMSLDKKCYTKIKTRSLFKKTIKLEIELIQLSKILRHQNIDCDINKPIYVMHSTSIHIISSLYQADTQTNTHSAMCYRFVHIYLILMPGQYFSYPNFIDFSE